jgi:hypothetical protein
LKYDTGAGTRPLIPKTPTQVLPEHPSSPTVLSETLTPINRPASLPVFQNEQEYNHFQTFCSRISEHFLTSVQREQWTRLMFHACETSPPVKTAVVGLGSLALSIPPLPPNYTKEFENSGHKSMLKQAGDLTLILQREVEGSQHEIPTTLLGTLLFNTFSPTPLHSPNICGTTNDPPMDNSLLHQQSSVSQRSTHLLNRDSDSPRTCTASSAKSGATHHAIHR